MSAVDVHLMAAALREARKGLGQTSPNPAVGALIVQDGQVLAKGHHRIAGGPHAEIEVLHRLPCPPPGAILFVTLEPCSTHGRTPPCTEAIIQAGIRRVVIGAIDPNPKHQGRGIKKLRESGIEVTKGVLGAQCTELNVGFNRWIQNRRPWVIAKIAQSLDGRLTRPPGETSWLTGPRAQRLVHRLRATVDAILVGAETVRRDDPALTVRGVFKRVQPWRAIVTRTAKISPEARVLTDQHRDRTLIYAGQEWSEILSDLGERGVTRLLVEGGGKTLGDLLNRQLIDEFYFFLAPLLTGGPVASTSNQQQTPASRVAPAGPLTYRRMGPDVLAHGFLAPRK